MIAVKLFKIIELFPMIIAVISADFIQYLSYDCIHSIPASCLVIHLNILCVTQVTIISTVALQQSSITIWYATLFTQYFKLYNHILLTSLNTPGEFGALLSSLYRHHASSLLRAEMVQLNYRDAARYSSGCLMPTTPPLQVSATA